VYLADRIAELASALLDQDQAESSPSAVWGEIGFVYAGSMDINRMLLDLRKERDQIVDAIGVLERLCLGRGKRRGRPPKWMTQAKRRGRPKGSKNKPKA